ncbi:MAG: substrate-binding domain-containing protein, partial [Armatimonadetes bacterium]|nr:substrate-binding domain-containing protein [Anaerolineae bacterium]
MLPSISTNQQKAYAAMRIDTKHVQRFAQWLFLSLVFALAACSGDDSGGGGGDSTTNNVEFPLPTYMQANNENYRENGGVRRPDNAIDVYILYSPESQQYLPTIIARFNQLGADGKNPVTGQALAAGERPIYVHGQQPTTGSSGTAAQGIINAVMAPNNANVYHPTIFQPSVSHWLTLINYQVGRELFNLAESQATALSPVVIAMWESRVQAIQTTLGKQTISWSDLTDVLKSPNGWQDYGIEAGRRSVYYGHADPNISSTGLSTNLSEYYTCARQNGFTERSLTLAAVNSSVVQDCVSGIEQLIRHYSNRTEDFLEYIARGPDYLDMVALEETDLICLNRGGRQGDEICNKPQERLVAIYPEEGTFWHEHPFGIVTAEWVTTEQQAAARVFTAFVLTPDMQR